MQRQRIATTERGARRRRRRLACHVAITIKRSVFVSRRPPTLPPRVHFNASICAPYGERTPKAGRMVDACAPTTRTTCSHTTRHRFSPLALVDLDGRVDLAREPQRGANAHSSRQQRQCTRDDSHVAEVEHGADEVRHVQTRPVVVSRVEEHVAAAGSRHEQRPPPPARKRINTRLEVGEHDGDLRARVDKDKEGQQQEAEHVVVLALLVIPAFCCVSSAFVPEAEVGTREHKRHRDARPEEEDQQDGAKRHSGVRASTPHEQVQEEEEREHDAREKHGRQHRTHLPALSLEHLVRTSRRVARQHTEQHEAHEQRNHQLTTVRRRQDTDSSEEQRDECHAQQLAARAHHDAEQHRVLRRRAEHVGVDELPARLLALLGALLLGRHAVVAADVAVKTAHEDHAHHATQEQHDDQRVDDGEPVHLVAARAGIEVHVPPCPEDRHLALLVLAHVERALEVARVLARVHAVVLLVVAAGGVLEAVGDDLEVHDAALVLGGLGRAQRVIVVADEDLDVVVELRDHLDLRVEAAEREAHGHAALGGHGGGRQVVQDPVDAVRVLDLVLPHLDVLVLVLLAAQHGALLALEELDLVRRVLDAVGRQVLA
ncbi:hypothetical protein ON010_g14423 [Phytophthora cinnamomi]|nr:hypothetical protein ON010_g14423 [Phytophthora cinnamomi]